MQYSFAKNKLYYYEPEVTEIEGTIITKTVKGHCDMDNDKYQPKNLKEVCPFLILDEPIDVKVLSNHSKTPPDDKPEKNIKILQIGYADNLGYNFENGERVYVLGHLFQHFRNCDHTRVLIYVGYVERLRKN